MRIEIVIMLALSVVSVLSREIVYPEQGEQISYVNIEDQYIDPEIRVRRSPDDKRHSATVTAGRQENPSGIPAQSFVRGDYNYRLAGQRNGPHVDANAFYQRNWGGGPRRDYGAGVRLNIPFR